MSPRKSLYRQQAIDHQRAEKLGEAMILPRRLHIVTSLVLVTIFLCALIYLANQTYTNKVQVTGWVVDPASVTNVNHLESSGFVKSLLVKNGEQVEKSQALMTIVRPQSLLQGRDITQKNTALIQQQLLDIKQQAKAEQLKTQKDLAFISQQHAHIQNQLSLKAKNAALLEAQHAQLKAETQGYDALANQGYLSQQTMSTHQQSLLEYELRIAQNQLDISTLDERLDSIQNETLSLQHSSTIQQNEYARTLKSLDIELATDKVSNEYIIRAPNAGQISSIQTYVGADLSKQKTLLKIVQSLPNLDASLYIPAQSIGLVKQSQTVWLRFDAFPHQQFGKVKAKITQVSSAILMPDELNNTPVSYTAPMFEANAALSKQSILVEGKALRFKHGMTFQANIELADKSIIQWLLAPIYRLKGAL